MSLEDAMAAARRSALLIDMSSRGLLGVTGGDRVRWLDGMISGDVAALEAGPEGAGCYAALLTNRGAIVADLHVGRLGERFLLESLRQEIPRIAETLGRFIIADDVELADLSGDFVRLGLEGPDATAILVASLEAGAAPPAPEAWLEGRIAGVEVLVAGFGWTGEVAYQLCCAPSDRAAVEAALEGVSSGGLVRADAEALEVLRVEAGLPWLGRELDEEVLPPEARLEHAISNTKGCYVGQEIVARLRARGQVNHLLVGLAIEEGDLPEVGAPLSAGGRETGELTSVVRSPSLGAIALGYVRREHAEPGEEITLEGGRARVCALPFVAKGDRSDAPGMA